MRSRSFHSVFVKYTDTSSKDTGTYKQFVWKGIKFHVKPRYKQRNMGSSCLWRVHQSGETQQRVVLSQERGADRCGKPSKGNSGKHHATGLGAAKLSPDLRSLRSKQNIGERQLRATSETVRERLTTYLGLCSQKNGCHSQGSNHSTAGRLREVQRGLVRSGWSGAACFKTWFIIIIIICQIAGQGKTVVYVSHMSQRKGVFLSLIHI